MTFAGKPRNQHRYDHAHESPRVMSVPLVVLAVFAIGVAWQPFGGLGRLSDLSVVSLLEQAAADGNRWPTPHRRRWA